MSILDEIAAERRPQVEILVADEDAMKRIAEAYGEAVECARASYRKRFPAIRQYPYFDCPAEWLPDVVRAVAAEIERLDRRGE